MQADLPRKDFGVRRDKEYIVKSKAFLGNSFIDKGHGSRGIFAKVAKIGKKSAKKRRVSDCISAGTGR